MRGRLRAICYSIPGVVIGVIAADGCGKVANDQPPTVDIDYCDQRCPDQGIADGYSSISRSPELDAFFASVIRFQGAASSISDGIQTELDAIAASVGAVAGNGADLKSKLAEKLNANVTGSLKVSYQPLQCTVSAKATLDALARCDTSIDRTSVSAQCDGSCIIDAGASVDCGAKATLICVGPAPGLVCMGTCQGECELTIAAPCSGTCRGVCTGGDCTVKDASGNCAGTCEGKCRGTCTLDAAASCSGLCKGECTYAPPDGTCEATAQARCDAGANATVDCTGICRGRVTPPRARAECEASARADASVDADCNPPRLNVSYQLSPSVADDAVAVASFQAWLDGFERHLSAIVAYKAKLDGVGVAGAAIAATAESAIKASVQSTLTGKLLVAQLIGLACGVQELPEAIKIVEDASTKLSVSSKAAVDLLGSFGAS